MMGTRKRRCKRCGKLFVYGAIKCECGCEEFLIVGMAPSDDQQRKEEPEDWVDSPELLIIITELAACGTNEHFLNELNKIKALLREKRGESREKDFLYGLLVGHVAANIGEEYDQEFKDKRLKEFKKREGI